MCFIANGSKQIKHCSLHHFLDASEEGYGQVTYLQTVDENNRIFCNIVITKSHVTPLKFVSVPRLEQNKADYYEVDEDDKEVKIIKINIVQIQSNILSTLESRISSWKKMKRVMAYVMLFFNKLKQKQCRKVQEVRLKEDLLDVEKIHNAEKMIVKLVQEGAFGPDIKSIKKSCFNENNQQHGSLQNKTLQELKPFVDENGMSMLVEDFRSHLWI